MLDYFKTQGTEQALGGLKVLDLGEYISAPLAAKMLGAFGSEVIKIERPISGDPARRVGPFLNDDPHPERSALFLCMNTNKKSITLDLATQPGVEILKRLVADADVLVENARPGVLPDLGLNYKALEKINPRLVMASITDFGQTGPYRDYFGGRLVDNALCGYAYLNGDPDREPLAGGGEQPAYQGGLHGYAGILAALLSRQATGEGQYLDIAILECMTSFHQFNINRYEYSGMVQKRVGNRYAYTHPTTIYPCKDGFVSICPATEEQTERLLLLMEMGHLLEDSRFETGVHRLLNADEFDALVQPWFLERGKKEIVETCQEWRVPAAYVNDCSDLLTDPQHKDREFWAEIDHPEAGRLPYAISPFRMSETPADAQRAPLLGEHNEEIFCGRLGMSNEDVARLRSDGVI
ncbi:MAG: CoA transferase [Desulfobacterales bacterium]